MFLSDVAATQKRRRFTSRTWNSTDYIYIAFMTVMHGLCLLAPSTFSWPMVSLFFASYFVTGCLGITLSFHRQLSHRAFATPKWLEYALAYCGVLAVQVCARPHRSLQAERHGQIFENPSSWVRYCALETHAGADEGCLHPMLECRLTLFGHVLAISQ